MSVVFAGLPGWFPSPALRMALLLWHPGIGEPSQIDVKRAFLFASF